MSYSLLTIQSLNNPPVDDRELPIFAGDWQLKLAGGERIIWQGKASALECSRPVGGIWKTTAKLLSRFDMTVTDKRIVYLCRKYKKGGMWFGGPLAVVFTLIGVGVAAMQRQGKAAIGQVRYALPRTITAKSSKLGPITFNEVTLTCVDGSDSFRVKLDLSKRDYEAVAATLAQQIAVFQGVAQPKSETKEESGARLIMYTLLGTPEN